MRSAGKSQIQWFRIARRILFVLLAAILGITPHSSYAQTDQKVRFVPGQFIQEPNCPVAVTQTRTELDVDPFDSPIDARVYLTYTNISNSPISAVSFRIRLTNEAGDNLGTFRGADGAVVAPGQAREQKFKQERINPRVTAMQVRVLQVKYADGGLWESFKMKELNNPTPDAGVSDGATAVPGQAESMPAPQPPASP